jgi:hypothetical protein
MCLVNNGASSHDMVILAIHLIATIAKLLLPGGARSVLSESLLLKHQLFSMVKSAGLIRVRDFPSPG